MVAKLLVARAGDADEADMADVQSCALFTVDTLAKTPNGVTSPTIVTFFAAKSILKDVTPDQIMM